MSSRDVLAIIFGAILGVATASFISGGDAHYKQGYADGRSQAHKDIADFCEYTRGE